MRGLHLCGTLRDAAPAVRGGGQVVTTIAKEPRSLALSQAEPLPHVPALDGLRAVAVTFVLFYHADFPWMQGGFLGVSMFFTLSGFLITALLLREWWNTAAINGRSFWTRRLRRLTPAAWTVIAAVVVLGIFRIWDTDQLRDLRSDVPWSMAELVNWHFISVGTSYGDAFSAPSPLEHFWSLAVETQFYGLLLVVIGAVLVLGRKQTQRVRLNRLVAALLVATLLSATANLLLARDSMNRAYFGTDTRAAEMLIGALLACLTLRHLRLGSTAARRLLSLLAAFAGLALLTLNHQARLDSAWLYPWGLLATAVCTALIIGGVLQGGGLSRVLELRGLVALGRISYGVYLIHWPIFLWLTPRRTALELWPLFALRMAIVIPLALILFHFVERPIRTRAWPAHSRAGLAVPLAAAVLLLGTLALTRDLPPPPSYFQERALGDISTSRPTLGLPADANFPISAAANVPTTVPITAVPRRPQRVLLVGDSVAASLQDALAQSLTARGITFASVATPGCGVIVGVPGKGPDKPITMMGNVKVSECENSIPQRQNDAVAQFNPDLVISASVWEGIDRTVNDVWYQFGTAESDAMLTTLFTDTHNRLTAGGAALAWVRMPDPVPARTTRPKSPNSEELRTTEHLRALIDQFVSNQTSTTVIDLAAIVCPDQPCPTQVNGITLRPTDGLHYDTAEAAAYVAERMSDLITQMDLHQIAKP